jgi:flagellar basal-body rod modification protein FlgD
MSAITGSSNTTASNTAIVNPSSQLGEQDFLKLLVTQLQYQDPTQPVDDTQFVSQLAQFSSLQEMTNVNSSMQLTQANDMIGKTITYTDSSDNTQSGVVTAVSITNGTAQLVVGSSDTKVDLSSVTGVTNTAANGTSNQTGS